MKVQIGRTSGPSTDVDVDSDFARDQIETVKDVLAMVNKATGNKEQWYLIVDDGDMVTPTVR